MENDSFTIHNPMYVTDEPRMQVLLAALGPVMLKLAGSRTDGTILWLADEKAIESHIAPRLNAAAAEAGRPAPRIVAGVPICLCLPGEVDAAKARADRVLSEATVSPNYQRLLDQGNATGVSDILAAGDEDMIRARLAVVRRGRRHRHLGARPADRRRPRPTPRVEPPHPRIRRHARLRPLTFCVLGRNRAGNRTRSDRDR